MTIKFRGKIRKGHKRGRLMNFPTANIQLHKNIPEGIYISLAKLDGQSYRSLTFIGSAIHFGEKDYKAEVYLFDFNKSIYHKWLSVTLLQKIRGNQKFSSEKALIHAMENDKKLAKEYFSKQS